MAGFQIDETLMLSGTEGFIKALADAAKQTQKDFGIFASVTLGQAIIESGWGKSNVARDNKNLFGIKYSLSYKPAPGINVKAAGRKCPAGEQGGAMYYVFYESYGDSVYDHGNFLKVNSRYTKAGVFTAQNAKDQMKAICAAGYAEVGGSYATSVIAAMDKYNLYQYDDLNGFTGVDMGSGGSGGTGGANGGGEVLDILPNVDHRYNIANMDKVKGACLIFLPPYNVCEPANRETHFKEWNK
jgi:flagellum-specific peptidoglycan hydrolase FlgJ